MDLTSKILPGGVSLKSTEFHLSSYPTKLVQLCSSSVYCDNFYTKADTGDKIKYRRIPKNKEAQQENTKKNTKKTTGINWD